LTAAAYRVVAMTIADICTIIRELKQAFSEISSLIWTIATAILGVIAAWNKAASALPQKKVIG